MARRPAGDAGPFVGRARELAAVAKLIADDQRTGIVLIGGEAGLGKTRLVDEVIGAHPGADVIRGGAVPRTTPVPFELVRTTVNPFHDSSLDLVPGDESTLSVVEQIRSAAELLRALHRDASIYVFEDIHWADPESLEVIDRLMAAGPAAASILVTYRPEALRPGHPVNVFLQRAERRANALQIRLEALRRDEVAEFLTAVRGDVGERTIDRVHGRTGGNPLFLSELVSAAADDAELTDALPWTLSEILRPEIERLADDQRAVAEAVAVLGAGAPFELVAAAVAVDEDELLTQLRHLVDTGILVESRPDRFDFRHELVREAVADGLFARERRRIHAAAHDALVAAGSDDETALITHAEGAGRLEEAAEAARSAAIRALRHGSSLHAFALAEKALLHRADDEQLLQVAVSAGWLSRQHRAALDHLARWSDLAGDEPASRAEILHWHVRLRWETADPDGADEAARELASIAEQLDDSPARAQAFADVAQHLMLSGRHEEAIEVADRAVDLAAKVGAPDADRQARAERASALLQIPGGREQGVDALVRVASEAEAAGDHLVASRALNNLPVLATRDPRRHLERMRTASQRAGMMCIATDGYRHALLELASAEGNRDEYEAVLDTALDDLDTDSKVVVSAAMLAVDDGRYDDARRLADRLDGRAATRKFSAADVRFLRDLIEFRASGAVSEIAAWSEPAQLSPLAGELVLHNLSYLIGSGLGRDVSRAIADRVGGCCADRAMVAIQAELAGDLDRAEAIYAEVEQSFETRAVVALAQVDLARARIARERGGADRPFVESALRRLRHWPSDLRDRLEAQLGERCVDTDPTRLTPREREVAQLVSEGRTNGGIADELFISTKTASVHVSNILAKLGMTSRAEIAAWVAAGGLAGP